MATGRNSLVASKLLAASPSSSSICQSCPSSRIRAAFSAAPAVPPLSSASPLFAHRASRIVGPSGAYLHGARHKHKDASKEDPDADSSPAAAFHQSLDEILQSEFQFTPEGRMISRHGRSVAMTLAEFEHFRPSETQGLPRSQPQVPPHQRAAVKERYLWNTTYQRIWSSLTVDQLKALAQEAGLKLQRPRGKSGVRKSVYVSELMKTQFGLVDPEERSQAMANRVERVEQHFPLSRIQLYLLLSDGGRPLNKIASQTGTRLRPDLSMEGGTMQFGVVVHGTKNAIERKVQAALDEFSENIISMKYEMQVPLAVLTPRVISAVSSGTQCAIQAMLPEQGAKGQANENAVAILELYALREANLRAAQIKLATLQADLHHAPRPLVSMATHSPLDPDYDDEAKSLDLAQYAFLPHICPPPLSWITESMTGGDSASVFRLQRIMENATWGATATGEDEPMTLVDVESPNAPLGGDRNWAWLHERLDPALLPDEKLAALPGAVEPSASDETRVHHSAEFGSLVFSSEPSEADKASENPVTTELSRLLKAPLQDSWPLDTAYEWLRKRDRSESELLLPPSLSRRPYWIEGFLRGLPVDSEGEFEVQGLRHLLGDAFDASPDESETIRLVYRVGTTGESSVEAIEGMPLRLHVEVEEVRVEVERESESETSEQPQTSSDAEAGAQSSIEATDEGNGELAKDTEGNSESEGKDPTHSEVASTSESDSAPSSDNDPYGTSISTSPGSLSLDALIGHSSAAIEEDIAEPAAAPETRTKLQYRIKSAYWATAQESDVLAPEFSRDLRLSTVKALHCQPGTLLEALPDLAEYLAKLDAYVDVDAAARADGESGEEGTEKPESGRKSQSLAQQQDPRQAPVPLPLLTQRTPVPPLQMDVSSGDEAKTLHFEKVERVARTQWPLRVPQSESQSLPDSAPSASPTESSGDDAATGEVGSSPPPPAAASPQHYGHLISETVISDTYRQAADSYGLGVVAKTVTKVEWAGEPAAPSPPAEAEAAQPAQPWRTRLEQVQALLRAAARLQPRKEPVHTGTGGLGGFGGMGSLFDRAAAAEGNLSGTQTKAEAREARESNPLGPWMPSGAAQSGVAEGAREDVEVGAAEEEGEEMEGLLKPSFRKD